MNQNLSVTFLRWFFVQAPLEIFRIGENFWIWGWHFFSISFFIPRIFALWHRDITPYGRGFDLKRIFHALGWNIVSRLIGAILRLTVIFLGLLFELFAIFLTLTIFVIWFLLPLVAVSLIIRGVINLF